jgi:hypothetical protein
MMICAQCRRLMKQLTFVYVDLATVVSVFSSVCITIIHRISQRSRSLLMSQMKTPHLVFLFILLRFPLDVALRCRILFVSLYMYVYLSLYHLIMNTCLYKGVPVPRSTKSFHLKSFHEIIHTCIVLNPLELTDTTVLDWMS